MPFVSSFTYCDGVNTIMTPQGPKNQLGMQLQAITPVAIPGNFTFSIVCGIADIKGKDNKIRIQFVDIDGNTMYDTQDIVLPPAAEENLKVKSQGVQFNLEMRNTVFNKEGIYATKILINGTEAGVYKIPVYAVGGQK